MPWRYALFVTPIESRWRVSMLDDVSTVPERVRDVDNREQAVRLARDLAEEIAANGDYASVTCCS